MGEGEAARARPFLYGTSVSPPPASGGMLGPPVFEVQWAPAHMPLAVVPLPPLAVFFYPAAAANAEAANATVDDVRSRRQTF